MTVHIALLRAVNLGGSTMVSMAALRERVVALGASNVRSLLQSGNLVFESSVGDSAEIERRLDREVAPDLGARTEFFVRTAAEWRGTVEQNPFPDEAVRDPGHLLLTVLKEAPSPAAWRRLAADIPGRERLVGKGRSAYLVYPDGVGQSKLSAAFIESRLGTRGTDRNWNTVRKLDALASGG